MSDIDVRCELSAYESEDYGQGPKVKIAVSSHWNYGDQVHLDLGHGKTLTIVAEHLIDALRRCSR